MGTFDSYSDSPFQIRSEGEEITITLAKTSDTTARVSWNIPPSVQGCASSNVAYCGMLVVLHTSPIRPPIVPVDGTQYTADATANASSHTGSTIGNALVIGAFYNEKDLQTKTTYVDITDLDANTAYYVAGFAVDCQYRYHTDGVRTYSAEYGNTDEDPYPGTLIVGLGGIESETQGGFDIQSTRFKRTFFGVLPSDSTQLTPGKDYSFRMVLCEDQPVFSTSDTTTTDRLIVVNGSDAQTYQDLINALNKQFALQSNPLLGPNPPYTGVYYWDATNQNLYLWNGTTLILQDPIIQDTDPTVRALGDFWYNPTAEKIYKWLGSPSAWSERTVIQTSEDPTQPDCDTYWYNPTTSPAVMRQWNGNAWCELTTYNSAVDPTDCFTPACGSYWLDTVNSILYEWSVEQNVWNQVTAVESTIAPTALPATSIWINDGSPQQGFYNTLPGPNNWVALPNITFSATEPTTPFGGQYWYDTANEILYLRNSTNTAWIDVEANGTHVVVYTTDPSDPSSCDLWFNPSSEVLYHWDTVTNNWNSVPSGLFYMQDTDPTTPTVNVDDIWYDITNDVAFTWDGQMWVSISFITFATDPQNPPTGTIWQSGGSPAWFEWNGTAWVVIDPIISDTDPNTLPTNTFWFDTANGILYQWNGAAWLTISYVTSAPTPAVDTLWFDTINMVLNKWNGSAWVEATLLVTASLENNAALRDNRATEIGDLIADDISTILLLTTGGTGSGFCVMIDSNTDTLFSSLNPLAVIAEKPSLGRDGVPGQPSYMTTCGDDGSPDERRAFIDRLRRRLGYPTVQVELSKDEWNDATDIALESLRQHSSLGYRRQFFFLFTKAGQQQYKLTNELTFNGQELGYQCIVDIMEIRRFTSAFLSTAYGAGVYGQIVLQHLYNMGTFDLLSYHLISNYIEQLEHLFASRIVFNWHEETRELWIHQTIGRNEVMLLDTATERTEQDLFKDRWVTRWLQDRALVEARLMLSETRGKYGALPGAGGGISLNAGDLAARADADRERLYQQLDDYVAERPEEWGIGTTFTIG